MENNGIAVASLCVAVIGTGSAILISLLRNSRTSGAEANRVTSLEFRLGTLEAETREHGKALSEYAAFVAGQQQFNAQQIEVNRLRESRENETNRQLAKLEGRIGDK